MVFQTSDANALSGALANAEQDLHFDFLRALDDANIMLNSGGADAKKIPLRGEMSFTSWEKDAEAEHGRLWSRTWEFLTNNYFDGKPENDVPSSIYSGRTVSAEKAAPYIEHLLKAAKDDRVYDVVQKALETGKFTDQGDLEQLYKDTINTVFTNARKAAGVTDDLSMR
ncbi:MAG: hypothetical protein MRY32_05770 [Rickettsiales bacterium]|nr:hypothetical protein [Rickettsiales bacterium]